LQAAGCALTVPKFNPNPPSSDNLVKVMQYGSVAIGVVAAAWAVGKVIELLPRPAR
jgi:hypothetical protein